MTDIIRCMTEWGYNTAFRKEGCPVQRQQQSTPYEEKCKGPLDMICTTVYGNEYSTSSVTAQDRQCRRVDMQRHVEEKSRTSFSDQEHGTVDPGLRVEYLA